MSVQIYLAQRLTNLARADVGANVAGHGGLYTLWLSGVQQTGIWEPVNRAASRPELIGAYTPAGGNLVAAAAERDDIGQLNGVWEFARNAAFEVAIKAAQTGL
jgi:hypothetical protein